MLPGLPPRENRVFAWYAALFLPFLAFGVLLHAGLLISAARGELFRATGRIDWAQVLGTFWVYPIFAVAIPLMLAICLFVHRRYREHFDRVERLFRSVAIVMGIFLGLCILLMLGLALLSHFLR